MNKLVKMTEERYKALVKNQDLKLTAQEIKDGWHFCFDWDFMLINKTWIENEHCNCGN